MPFHNQHRIRLYGYEMGLFGTIWHYLGLYMDIKTDYMGLYIYTGLCGYYFGIYMTLHGLYGYCMGLYGYGHCMELH